MFPKNFSALHQREKVYVYFLKFLRNPLKNFLHFPGTESANPAGSGYRLKLQTGANRAIKKQIESHRTNRK